MSIVIPEKDLPLQLTPEVAVESAYATELAEVASKLQRGLPALVECDKDRQAMCTSTQPSTVS